MQHKAGDHFKGSKMSMNASVEQIAVGMCCLECAASSLLCVAVGKLFLDAGKNGRGFQQGHTALQLCLWQEFELSC